jgi:hypothetical protein
MVVTVKPKNTKRSTRRMSEAHKAALLKGREEGRAVRLYLEALETSKPRRGRRRTPESIKKRLAVLDTELTTATPLTRLHLLQEQRDLEAELVRDDEPVDLAALEKGFIKAAKAYGERKGIAYSSWRTAGVNPAVLAKAGIARTRG